MFINRLVNKYSFLDIPGVFAPSMACKRRYCNIRPHRGNHTNRHELRMKGDEKYPSIIFSRNMNILLTISNNLFK